MAPTRCSFGGDLVKSRRPLLCALALLCTASARADDGLPSYYERYRFLAAPPSTWDDGLLGFAQPANLGLLRAPEARLHWSSDPGTLRGLEDWGVFTAVPHLGFSVQTQDRAGVSSTDYALGSGFGTQSMSLGLQYGFGGGDAPRDAFLAVGSVWRPAAFVSLSGTGRFSLESNDYEWTGELGVRPLRNRRLTIFGDFAWAKGAVAEDVPWSAGAAAELLPGVDLVGRYFDGGALTLGVKINLGHAGVFSQSHVDRDGDYSQQTWAVRAGGLRPGLSTGPLATGRRYVSLHPLGSVRYLKYRHFDSGGDRLFELLSDIRRARESSGVSAIALNLSGVSLLPEHAWEVRLALEEARQAGKTVVIFFDHAGMTGYHLASVADHVVMDPHGSLLLPGYAIHKTYLRGSLEKLGLAFDEWRYFTYKSAAETLVRDDMSPADREQTQAFVDDWYEQTRRDVCDSRGLTPAAFDSLVDEKMLFTSDSARVVGLVDTLARWSDRDRVMAGLSGKPVRSTSRQEMRAHSDADDRWGEKPRIALVYGLGVCDLDEGIRARWLEGQFQRLARDRSIKAVVFRVDSPGGDPLASDLVAQAVKSCSERKPVIVSMGQVAASGGYWLSMCADSVVAGPATVTGSIGVIGGWLYDSGASSKLGMTADVAQRGRHADYNAGIRLPVLGTPIPRRTLSSDEQARVQDLMGDLYRRFTAAVALNRGLTPEEVSRLAEGRIYSGLDARSLGLVDEVGGLLLALDLACARAGIAKLEGAQVVEYPSASGWFAWPWRSLKPLSAATADEWQQLLLLLGAFNGKPLTLLLPDHYPGADD